MAAQTERVLTRARERFAVQDYYGTVHLLEEIVAGGRAFADVHHLLGVSLSLLGHRERALAEFDRALQLNPRYLEALIHPGLVLQEMGRETQAEDSFRRAAASIAPSSDGGQRRAERTPTRRSGSPRPPEWTPAPPPAGARSSRTRTLD